MKQSKAVALVGVPCLTQGVREDLWEQGACEGPEHKKEVNHVESWGRTNF